MGIAHIGVRIHSFIQGNDAVVKLEPNIHPLTASEHRPQNTLPGQRNVEKSVGLSNDHRTG